MSRSCWLLGRDCRQLLQSVVRILFVCVCVCVVLLAMFMQFNRVIYVKNTDVFFMLRILTWVSAAISCSTFVTLLRNSSPICAPLLPGLT